MPKMPTAIVAALLLVLTLLLAVSRPSPARAQAGTTSSQGAIEAGIYTYPAAGFQFKLPQRWLRSAYQWNDYWGTAASARMPDARYVVEWMYSPTNRANREATLLTFTVYDQVDWEAIADEPGPSVGEVVAESDDSVYVATFPQANPYPSRSVDAQRFDNLVLSLDEVEAAFSLTGEATFAEPDLWCLSMGTGATFTVNGERANFDCGTDGNTIVVLAGEAVLGEEGWQITRANVVNRNGTFQVRSTEEMLVSHIELQDGTVCAEAGTGATFPVNGERVNYTCDEEGVVLAGGIESGEDGWEILKANVESTDEGWETLSSSMEPISALGVTALD
ncbi:MAG TPA: hypothetical protein VF707_15325 [Ardenticatenaceae bacterium]|jgi:hypothetical protein